MNGAVTSNLFVTVQWLLKQLKLAKLTEEREFNIFTFKILSQSTSVNVIVATFEHHEFGPVGALLQVALIHASEMLRQHVRFFIIAMKYWIHYITYNVILKFEFQSQYWQFGILIILLFEVKHATFLFSFFFWLIAENQQNERKSH